jgi:soluble lytic murein transglycosylase-like protein
MGRVMLLMFGALVFGSCVSLPVVAAQPAVVSATALDLWTPFIAEAAARFGIPEAWIRTVMAAESGGRTVLDGRPVTSRSGAIGLMQVMPDTYEDMRHAYGLGSDPYDPRDNILAGAAYLRAMFERFGWPGFFAAYNAGPERYADHLRTGLPLPAETQVYLAMMAQIDASPPPSASPSGTRLFFTLRTVADASSNAGKTSASSGLFIPLTTVPDGQR